MKGLFAYSGLTTKIRAMTGKLLTDAQYSEIAGMRTVTEVVAYLKQQSGYKRVFATEDEAILHRDRIEHLLRKTVYMDYGKIYNFADVKQQRFLDLYFMRYEISVIKMCLRMIFDKRDTNLDLSEFEKYFKRGLDVEIVALTKCKTIDELVTVLEGSAYYSVLSKLSGIEIPTLFDYEMALDIYYFKRIWKQSLKLLKQDDQRVIVQSVGRQIDLLNLQWIYRAKKYFQMNPADIYAFIIPIHYKLTKEQVKKLIEAESAEEMKNQVVDTSYGDVAEIEHASLEEMYTQILDKVHMMNMRKYPYSVACMDTYFYRKEREIGKLVTAIECVRYGLSVEETKTYVV